MGEINRIFSPPEESLFLFGPRGTGKSTLIRKSFPDAVFIDLLEPQVAWGFQSRPEQLRDYLRQRPERKTVVLDEVQKVPDLLSVVHGLIEEKNGVRFVLTGSSARKLKKSGADLLAGRALWRTLHPFMACELGDQFHLGDALERGLLPVVVDAPHPLEILRSYVGMYIKEEVQSEGIVRHLGPFARFMQVFSLSHGGVLNASNLARECQVTRRVVESYIQILEDLLLSFTLPVFTKRAKRKVVSHPKVYLFDAGVFQSLRPRGPYDRPEEIAGQALEGLVAQHLRAWNAYSSEEHQLFYWRTAAGVEVDFVVYGPEGVWALEVKNTDRARPQDIKGLRAFREDYPESRALFLYRGEEELTLDDGVRALPVTTFLRALRPGQEIN
jgi:predicted AAA+ superfamily ATPase